MTTLNPLKSEYQRVGGPQLATLATLAETWIVPCIDGITVSDFVAGALKVFIRDGKVWKRDDSDTTSAADGVTVWVTGDTPQVRFKSTAIVGSANGVWSVAAFQNAPPDPATAGACYGIGAAPTGAWAAYANYIATCLVGGGVAAQVWAVTPPSAGLIARDRSRAIFRSYVETNAWQDGLANSFGARSIAPEALAVQRYAVQATVNDAPGSPVDGLYWLIGSGATGTFAGRAGQIAKRVSGAWTYLTAFSAGDKLWDIGAQAELTYVSGAWSSSSSPKIIAWPARVVRGATIALSGASPGQATAPTSATGAQVFPEGASPAANYTLGKAANRLLVRLRVDLSATAGALCFAMFVDGQLTCAANNWRCTNPVDGGVGSDLSLDLEFEIAVGDTAAHTYYVRGYGIGTVQRAFLQFVEIQQ